MALLSNASSYIASFGVVSWDDNDYHNSCHPTIIDFLAEHGISKWPDANGFQYWGTFTSDEFCGDECPGNPEHSYLMGSNGTNGASGWNGLQNKVIDADATAWATSTSYSHGDIVYTTYNSYKAVWYCHTAHTSGASTKPPDLGDTNGGADWWLYWYWPGVFPGYTIPNALSVKTLFWGECDANGKDSGCPYTGDNLYVKADVTTVYDSTHDQLLFFCTGEDQSLGNGLFRRTLSNSLSLGTPTRVMDIGSVSIPDAPGMVFDDSDRLHCWGNHSYSGDKQIHYMYSDNYGATWSTLTPCTSDVIQNNMPQTPYSSDWVPGHQGTRKLADITDSDGNPIVIMTVCCGNPDATTMTSDSRVALVWASIGSPTTVHSLTTDWLLQGSQNTTDWDESGCYKPCGIFAVSGSELTCRFWYDGFNETLGVPLGYDDHTGFTSGNLGIYLPITSSDDDGVYITVSKVDSNSTATNFQYGWGSTPPASPSTGTTGTTQIPIQPDTFWFRGYDENFGVDNTTVYEQWQSVKYGNTSFFELGEGNILARDRQSNILILRDVNDQII